MPFTPFHMGPGIAIKALLRGSFSLMVFGWSQIVMDIQPLLAMLTGEGRLHGFTHTYIGAFLLAVFSGLTGKYLGQFGLFVLGVDRQRRIVIGWTVAIVSAFMGTFSHVLLDSIMHADMTPLAPFSSANAMLYWISVDALHVFCLVSALVGALVYWGVSLYLAYRD